MFAVCFQQSQAATRWSKMIHRVVLLVYMRCIQTVQMVSIHILFHIMFHVKVKQTNTTDENGDILSARFEVFVTDGAAPLGEAYIADSDCAVMSVQALAETTTAEGEQKQWLDSDVTSLYRDKGTDEFKKTQKEKEKMEDTFSDANVEQCDNTGFAYCFAQGTGISEYLVQTMQQRVTREGKQTCTYRLLPVYWKYDADGVQKRYSVYLPEDGYAVPYTEQVNGNEPYLLYDLSICFASMDEIGISDWSKISASAHDGDNKTFVLSKNTSLGHLTAPKFTGLAGEKEKAYTLLDQTNQPVSEILAKTNEISWSLNSDWEKAAGFDATLFFNCQDGQTKEITFYWRAEDWIKDPAAWEASYGSSLLEKLTVCEAKEEETTEEKSTEEKSIEESSTEEASSEKATTESVSRRLLKKAYPQKKQRRHKSRKVQHHCKRQKRQHFCHHQKHHCQRYSRRLRRNHQHQCKRQRLSERMSFCAQQHQA